MEQQNSKGHQSSDVLEAAQSGVAGGGVAHTPGPWTQEPSDHRPDWFVISHSEGAGCQPEIIGGCHNEDDARLIAAAPDLLAALTEAVRLYENYSLVAEPVPGEGLNAGRWISDARATIARATGAAS